MNKIGIYNQLIKELKGCDILTLKALQRTINTINQQRSERERTKGKLN